MNHSGTQSTSRLSNDPVTDRAKPSDAYVQAIRALDESTLARSYWHFYWEDEQSHWYEETVDVDGEEWTVKQLIRQ